MTRRILSTAALGLLVTQLAVAQEIEWSFYPDRQEFGRIFRADENLLTIGKKEARDENFVTLVGSRGVVLRAHDRLSRTETTSGTRYSPRRMSSSFSRVRGRATTFS